MLGGEAATLAVGVSFGSFFMVALKSPGPAGAWAALSVVGVAGFSGVLQSCLVQA